MNTNTWKLKYSSITGIIESDDVCFYYIWKLLSTSNMIIYLQRCWPLHALGSSVFNCVWEKGIQNFLAYCVNVSWNFITYERNFSWRLYLIKISILFTLSLSFKISIYLLIPYIRRYCQILSTNFSKTTLWKLLKFGHGSILIMILVKNW